MLALEAQTRLAGPPFGTVHPEMIPFTLMGGVPREQRMLRGHLPRVIYYQVYSYAKSKCRGLGFGFGIQGVGLAKRSGMLARWKRKLASQVHPSGERVLYCQPDGLDPLNHFSRPALRRGGLNSLFQVALYLRNATSGRRSTLDPSPSTVESALSRLGFGFGSRI